MAAHERWRVYITATLSNWICQILECELRGTVGGPDLTGSGTPFTGVSNPGTEIFDDNVATGTTVNSAGSFPCFFGYHFGAGNAQHVEEFTITTDGSYDRAPTDFELQVSDDGSTWTTVRTFTGVSWSANETKTFAGDPTPGVSISDVSPASGTIAGGTAITIAGTGFAAGATVTVGGAAATSIVVVSATEITAVTPAHAAGVVDVAVTVDSTTATSAGGFTYLDPFRIDSVSPAVAYRGGGSSVTIAGAGYVAGAQVLIDGRLATVTSLTATEIVATVPAAPAAGAVTLKVRLPDTSERTAAFTYEDHAVTSVSPTTLPQAGGALQVNGRYFLSGASVLVDGAPVSTTFTSATELHATIPAGLALGLHDVAVANGTRGTTPALADAFLTVAPASSGSTVLFVVT